MSTFQSKYAGYYESVYAHKDYLLEVDVILKIQSKYAPEAKSVLDFGCGTGRHDAFLVEAGLEVTGLDRSHSMLKLAQMRRLGDQGRFLHIDQADKITDRSIDFGVSLFDVVSYLTNDEDLNRFFELMFLKTKPSAPLIFDFWHLPAVVHLKPETRKKVFSHKNQTITRISESFLDCNSSCVTANHEFYVSENEQLVDHFSESHLMRCFSKNEMVRILSQFGYTLASFGTWSSPKQSPTLNDWSVLAVAIPHK